MDSLPVAVSFAICAAAIFIYGFVFAA